MENVPFALSTRRLAHALGLSGSCVAEATAALARKGRLLPVEKSVGRRPATYKLGSPYTKHEKHGGKTAASPKLDFGHQAA